MKTILVLSILLCIIAHSAHSEPPQNSVETDIAVIKTEIKNLKESMNTGFANVQNNFDRQNNIIIACIGIPMIILTIGATIWGILAHRRSRKEDTLQNQIETLKKQRIVS
ncbi:hypothetical protein C6501_10825 [Candidatus Poribacteria bacterium]|nr:MAG: hypothetical protein C6501_10825 [Candidatus Poribacteria bacterium]